MLFESFLDEMQKISGVELNLYGYKSDPTLSPERREELEAAVGDYYKKVNPKTKRPVREDFETRPGFFASLLGRKPTFDQEGFDAQKARHSAELAQIYKSLGPAPLGASETVRTLRAGAENETAGKLTARILGDYGSVREMDTDEAYSDTPYSRYLDDDKLDRIVEIYKREMNRFGPEAARQDSDARYHQMFLDRASQLKKNPKAKGYRLEWG